MKITKPCKWALIYMHAHAHTHIEVLSNHNCLKRWKKSNKNARTHSSVCEWIKARHIHKTIQIHIFHLLKIRHAQDFYERRFQSMYSKSLFSIEGSTTRSFNGSASFISSDFRYKLLFIILICRSCTIAQCHRIKIIFDFEIFEFVSFCFLSR